VITVGVGASTDATAGEVLAAVEAVLPADATHVRLATLEARAGLVAQAAAQRGWSVVAHPAAGLAAVPVPSPSGRVAVEVGTPSVAEAAALLGGGRLLVGKTVVGRVTVAVAES
jgi:cobalamin biosynthesis protein CbiG